MLFYIFVYINCKYIFINIHDTVTLITFVATKKKKKKQYKNYPRRFLPKPPLKHTADYAMTSYRVCEFENRSLKLIYSKIVLLN